ncbi:PASTA domain-containing protein [Frigoribacterium sp. MEB024]|uniref:PASTA domain-containing protein n=1 Tax=Frigoribacterium sp. MEB024 TaxID=1589899 RepID=UPI0018CFE0E6|nr:PASTA domain-containing protein [Frigoribacterium sp. MEB024]
MKKTITAGVVACLMLVLAGCSEPAPLPRVPDVIGMDGAAAEDALEDYEVEFDAGDDHVFVRSNWNVDSMAPSAGSPLEEGETVVLSVSKPGTDESPEPSETSSTTAPAAAPVQPAEPTITSGGLDAGWAVTACDQYGKDTYVYGWDGDWLIDGTSQIVDDKWFLKAGADITNAFGAERRATVECTVVGSNGAPLVESFLDY